MNDFKLRRSSRLNTHDPNGRDYLCSLMGWSRHRLENWITSATVRPHLQLWYRLCIQNDRRYNEAVEWINTGDKGYYYRDSDLEEDLLLACLCEGSSVDEDLVDGAYADQKTKTEKWITQELWARKAWRIVQANRGEGDAFGGKVDRHPAACYAFAIDLLAIAFHSISHRSNTESVTSISTISSSTETSDNSEDLDFEDASSRTSSSSGVAPRSKWEADGESDGAAAVGEWIASQRQQTIADGLGEETVWGCFTEFMGDQIAPEDQDPHALQMVDEYGLPITGYRRAGEVQEVVARNDEEVGSIQAAIVEAKMLAWDALHGQARARRGEAGSTL
ncbi:hypothetical protein LTR85_000106 [Meristemomyces frigidus]|nr:hypothetical protein LTR85_000106 [Meristemomyces frigidus]